MSGTKIRFLGELEGSLSAQAIATALDARSVGNSEDADLVVTTPADLEEMLEDAAASAAFHATRNQETVPAEIVDRLLAGDSPVKVWREYRGLTQRALATRAGLNFTYLSQLETGARKGTTATMKKLAEALGVDLDDVT
jgi:DNA-binding XRE family transcriptional regulator